MISLSDRLGKIAEMVIPGKAMADVGTDHGYIPISLLEQNKVPFAILCDINAGPLEIAKRNIESASIPEDAYCLRLGSGLEPLINSEVTTVVIAGMGGELIEDILSFDIDKSKSFSRFILQPRTHANELRHYLSVNSFEIKDYALVKEKERICEIIAAEPAANGNLKEDISLISDFLINKGDPLLREFVDYKIRTADAVLENLSNSGSQESEALSSVWRSILSELKEVRKNI